MILFDRRTFRAFDYLLLGNFALLLGFGVVLVASASDASHYQRQLVWAAAAVVLAIVVSALDYRKLVDRAYELWGVTMIVLVGMLFFAPLTSNTRSWVSIGGVGIQPSELAKVIVILALAHYFAERDPRPFGMAGLVAPGLLVVVPFVLIALQPDLGTASTFLPMVAGIAWVAGIRLKTAAWISGVGLSMAPLGYFLLEDYQRQRLLTFWNPEVDPLGDGYQIIQSKIAVGSGGLLGKGLFSGTQSQLQFLPAQHTDLVFAVLGEELGFLGVAAALTLYLMLLLRVLQTARISRDRAGTYIASGVAAVMLYHLLVNVGMVIGFAPITGIPLPLLSYGGSSALASGIAIGLVISVRTRRFLN
ncbi:MAG: rod shape-determining protein RodA [Acidobacteriota bacterium]|jgi:rod shape determining protein RodA